MTSTITARNDFRVDIEDGMLKSLLAGLDTSSPFAFFKSAVDAGGKVGAAAVGVSVKEMDGDFGLPTGIYAMTPDGGFERVPAAK